MEELHAAAWAYYTHGTPELQGLARSFFQSMDTDRDGRVSLAEFSMFIQQSGYNWVINDPNFFAKLDRNRDGGLDFAEVLTFYYIVKTRSNICCHGCGDYLCGLYFTCVTCFDGQCPYDLCAVCYGNSNFHHHHSFFLDNHILLRSKRGLPPCATPNLNMAITPVSQTPLVIYHNYYVSDVPERNNWFQSFRLFEMAIAAASVAANCTIM